ncbi:MAG: DNA mismatch repair protein MutL, partial [Butyricicoccus sp.]|nr:DNA mismatch repair protein MutL [Butyricicoccus sp.]
RGEALAAIASVSRIDLFTKQKGNLAGVHLMVEAGEILEQSEAGCPDGTSLIVRDLFFNTPARMKFLKKDFTEANYVLAVVQHAALSHPEIAFSLTKDGTLVFSTSGNGKLISPVFSIFGREMTENMIEVPSFSKDSYTAWGYVSKPHAGRPNRSMQNFFVNGRFIHSKLIQAAVEEAYRNKIITGKFPACVIFLNLPLHMVDVNVHPTKTEVKFAQEKQIFDTVYVAVRNALEGSDNTPVLHADKPATRQPREDNLSAQQQRIVVAQKTEKTARDPDYLYDTNGIHNPIRKITSSEISALVEKTKQELAEEEKEQSPPEKKQKQEPAKEFQLLEEVLAGFVRRYPTEDEIKAVKRGDRRHTSLLRQEIDEIKTAEACPHKLHPEQETKSDPQDTEENTVSEEAIPDIPDAVHEEFPKKSVRVIGEAFKTYLIAEDEEGLILLDKHAAHERMIFNQLRATADISQQELLVPVIADLPAAEFAAIRENLEQVRAVGFEIDIFGVSSLAVRTIPAYLDAADVSETLSEIADKLLTNRIPVPDRLDDLIHTVACKAAIKAGKSTDTVELQHLCEQVLSDPDVKSCPHGRPVTVRLTKYEIDKLFKRVNQ